MRRTRSWSTRDRIIQNIDLIYLEPQHAGGLKLPHPLHGTGKKLFRI